MHRSLVPLAIAAATLLLASGCGGSDDSPDSGSDGTDTIDVGAIAIVDTAPLHLAQERGYFAEQKLKAEITSVQGGAAGVTGVVSGQFDFGFANVTSLLTAREQGLPVKAVCNGVASTGEPGDDFSAVLVKKDSPVRDAADLEGRTIAVNQLKNIGDTTVRASVRKAGGDPSKVTFVEMPLPDMPAALENGRVDAIWTVEPFVAQSTGQGARPVAWNYADAAPDLTVALYFTTEKTAEGDPDLVKRFTAAMDKALAYADAHPDAVRRVLGEYTEIPAPTIAKIRLPKWPTAVNEESVRTIAGLAREDGTLKKDADVAALLP